jgi:hypothetical protein
MHEVEVGRTEPYYPLKDVGGYYFLDESGERVNLEADITRPVLMWKDKLTLQPGDLPGVDSVIETQYGQWLINVIGFTYPYNGKVPYIAKGISPNTLHQAYIDAINAGIILTRTDLRKGVDGLEMLVLSDSEFGVKSSSSIMMDDDPVGDKLREDMLKEYGERIEDPVVQAEFDARLIAHKKTIVQGSGAEDFYGKGGKIYGTVLMKTDGRYGAELDTAGKPTKFIAKSLKEGLDMEMTTDWINAARTGSYSRGALTALSGVDVKEIIRALSSCIVNEDDDCGTKVGQIVHVDRYTYKTIIGVYLMGKTKEPALTDKDAEALIGQSVVVRAPSGCKSTNLTYCKACMGVYTKPNAIALGAAEMDSILMYVAMKAAHGFSKEVVTIDLLRHTS